MPADSSPHTATDVAVVIPLYNGARWIRDTLASVRNQQHAPAEIVVVDDGSSDDAPQMAAAVEGVRVLSNPGQGVGEARQFGFVNTSAPFVAFLDQDDLWHPAHLRELLRALREHPACVAAVSDEHAFSSAAELSFPDLRYDPARFNPWDTAPLPPASTPGAVLLRRAALEQVGGWSTQFEESSDVHTWLRLSADRPFVRTGATTLAYRHHPAAQNVRMRRHAMSTYADDICAAYADALSHRLDARPEEASTLNRRLEALRAAADLVRGVEDERPTAIRQAATALEAALAEDPGYLGSLCTLLYWLLDARLSDPDVTARLRAIELLTNAWPRDAAPRTWRRIGPPMLTKLSLWQSIRHAGAALLTPQRWTLPWAVMRDRLARAWPA